VGTLNSITVNGEWVEDQQQTSLLAEAGKKMVPLFAPMGVEEENWPAVVGLLTGILAKEVVIGTLNSLYEPQGNPSQDSHTYGEMVKRFQGQPNAFAYLLFVLLYFPCVSATAAMVREVQRKWTIFSVCWTTGLAYAVAVIYYQCATFVMHPWISGEWIVGLIGTGLLGLLGLRHYGRVYLPRNVPTPITLT
jgi:ferrous iron transport protein B